MYIYILFLPFSYFYKRYYYYHLRILTIWRQVAERYKIKFRSAKFSISETALQIGIEYQEKVVVERPLAQTIYEMCVARI